MADISSGAHIVVGSDKGGVGKDLAAEGVYQAALLRGLKPTMIEVETARRLGLLYPETISINLNVPSAEAVYANPDVVFAALDQAGDIWRGTNLTVTSLGANVASAVVVWGASNGAKMLNNGANMTFVVPLTMNRHAMSAGLANLFDFGTTFPAARRIAILNDLHAMFMDDDRFLAKRLEEARGEGKPIETIRLPRCSAPAWGYAQNHGTLAEIARLDPEELIKLGLPEGPVRRSMSIITTWIADALIGPLGALLPEQQPAPRAQRKSK